MGQCCGYAKDFLDPSLSIGPCVLTMRVGIQKICTLEVQDSMGTTMYDDAIYDKNIIIRVVCIYIYMPPRTIDRGKGARANRLWPLIRRGERKESRNGLW